MEDLFGPLAPHAEFSVGQLVHYSDEHGVVRTGEITWIEGPGKTIRGDHHPLQYWVNGLICLYQSDSLGISYAGLIQNEVAPCHLLIIPSIQD
jgi:hypothetical protein